MNEVELERKFELDELLDLAVTAEVIRHLADMIGVQIRIFDLQGQEVFNSGGEAGFCALVRSAAAGDRVCEEVKAKLLGQSLGEGSAFQAHSACGNKYTVFPVRHQFENVGRVVLGPYQDASLDNAKLEVIAAKFRLDAGKIIQGYRQLHELAPERMKKIAKFMARLFDAVIFINAKRLITSLMHLELIMQSRDKIFQEMDKQSEGTADKKEIEKLKGMF